MRKPQRECAMHHWRPTLCIAGKLLHAAGFVHGSGMACCFPLGACCRCFAVVIDRAGILPAPVSVWLIYLLPLSFLFSPCFNAFSVSAIIRSGQILHHNSAITIKATHINPPISARSLRQTISPSKVSQSQAYLRPSLITMVNAFCALHLHAN